MAKNVAQDSSSLIWETSSVYMSEKQQSSLAYSRMNSSYPDGEDNRGLAGQQTNRHVPAHTCLSLDKTEEILANAGTTQTLPRVRSLPNTTAHAHLSQGSRQTKEVVGAPEGSGKTLEKLSGAAGFMLRCYLRLCRETSFDVLSHRLQARGNGLVK